MNARLLLIALLAALAPAFGKSAEDYFHDASYKYVAGKRQDARLEVEEGLRHHPDDPRLKSLAGLLKDLDDSQKPQGGEGDDSKDKKDDKNKDPGNNPDKNENPEKEKKPQDKEDKKDGKDGGKDKEPPRDDPNARDVDGDDGRTPPGRPGEMSREEAQRLLNSFADDEKKEQRELQKRMRKRLETEQDW